MIEAKRENLRRILIAFVFADFFSLVSNIQCDLTRSAGARYRDSNSDYVNTSQQHYVLYGDRNAPIDGPISLSNVINHSNEGRRCCSLFEIITR